MTRGSTIRRKLQQITCQLMLLGLGALSLTATAELAAPAPDAREVYSTDSPGWLRAVGKLQVPGDKYHDGRRSHYKEDCSATLVARGSSTRADTIITAWHCLEFYNDLSRPITFTLLPGSPGNIASEAYRLADGGGMHADWAILRLYKAVPAHRVAPLGIHPERADPGRAITMAGYSRDSGMGNNGEQLTFDPACTITHQAPRVSDSDCTAHKGSSGGPVIQVSTEGEPRVCGVISQGDGAGLSTFVPVSGFRNAINLYLR